MSWISGNRYLSESEMQNNALEVWNFFGGLGWTIESVSAMLGNMETESTINPGIWENLIPWPTPVGDTGMGLVGWTPYTRITNWLSAHGFEATSGEGQCLKLREEMEHPEIEVTWIPTTKYNYSFREFTQKTDSPYDLALAFLANYERPADPNQPVRGTQALKWYQYLQSSSFVPRLSKVGMLNSKYWYSSTNPFYPTYGLPNCTCYAWGRFWEISDIVPHLPPYDGGEWWTDVTGYQTGSTPELGAVACFQQLGGAGHVCIVEEINSDGTITTSNSGYSRNPGGYDDPLYFWLDKQSKDNNYLADWMVGRNYLFQGFIYNPFKPVPPPPKKKHKMPIWMYTKLF